ncbi:DNA repair protein RecO [Schlegelella sp. ID0723]|uniref:DNA repair protein RecO n=2 Tax=Piscinibacter koreensis TaxID=2742824 RepID=A0A7Y6NPJ2_9BURK|nr:DNA repair protein RecO [Schlegelella koreensis]NUZ06960.1 DNA repair protein RecO [Schlegelella koreensis]
MAAYVLHRYDWSESSLILDVFTRERGRVAVAAKGAKKPYSQLRSVLLPFQRLLLSFGRAPDDDDSREVHNLRSAEWAGGGPMLSGAALFSGFYLNELLMKLLARQDPHPVLFDIYAATLGTLALADDGAMQGALRAFELVLLREIGWLPDLSVETQTQQAVEPGRGYALRPDAGVAASTSADAAIGGAALVGLEAALRHGDVRAIQAACAGSLAELKSVLRAQLHYHLGAPLLRTRQVMIDAQNLV